MWAPRRIGRFLVFPAFASGGMATVHLARMTGPLGFSRLCAVKRLHPHHARDPEVVAMLLDEARLAARISSPHVAPILDVVTEDGELLLAMEYVRGLSLAELRRSTSSYPPPVGVAVSIVVQLLRGLHAAHETRGDGGAPLRIVHRDVSPQNVVVDVEGFARIVDFGVAKATWRAQSSRTGDLKGKLSYMAPEQLRGEPVDRRADVFGASVVLWELLTGQRMFAGEGDVLASRLAARPVEPASSLRREAPEALDAIVARGLAASPSDRFATADDMARALLELDLDAGTACVAEWVRAAGGERLDEREAELSRVVAWAVSNEPPSSTAQGEPDAPFDRASEISEPTTTALMSNGAARAPLPTHRRALGVLLVAAFVLVSVRVAWSLGARGESAPASPSPEVTSATALATVEPSAAAPTASAPGSATAAVAAASAVAAPPSKAKPRAKPSADPCSPPWSVDDAGVRTFKVECL